MSDLEKIKKELKKFSCPVHAIKLAKYFKTGKDEYGEGDIFIGVRMGDIRKIACKFKNLSYSELKQLTNNKIHDYRWLGFVILVNRFSKIKFEIEREKIFNFYLKNLKYVNNWDLVDISAPKIVGEFLLDKNKNILYKLTKSGNLWERRIAVIATFAFIKNNDFKDTLKISKILLNDEHDLVHKAVGWMLREVGKRNQKVEEEFLNKYYKKMPRVMLRYSIEKFSNQKRKFYLKK
ncbi:MAG: DNA alkylation repair protein [Patescibacteria group bacterium]|nr:DNA alkylation repair protein [Patescibacteria group bacterium]